MPQKIFKIYDGRTNFWQWDTKQKLIVLDNSITQVHFSNKNMTRSIPRDVYTDKDGVRVCDVPSDLLKAPINLTAYACTNDTTTKSVKFAVVYRQKPGDYVEDQTVTSIDTDTQYQIVKIDDYNYKLQSKGKKDEVWVDVVGSTIALPSYVSGDHTHKISDIDGLQDELDKKTNTDDLADIAFSGSTDDLVQGSMTIVLDCNGADVDEQ